jgi:hypothetical protein
MLRTASSLPLAGLLTLGSDPARFPTEPPACYRASWQLPGPDSHRQATTSLRTARSAATSQRHLPICWAHESSRLTRCSASCLDIAPARSYGKDLEPAPRAAEADVSAHRGDGCLCKLTGRIVGPKPGSQDHRQGEGPVSGARIPAVRSVCPVGSTMVAGARERMFWTTPGSRRMCHAVAAAICSSVWLKVRGTGLCSRGGIFSG